MPMQLMEDGGGLWRTYAGVVGVDVDARAGLFCGVEEEVLAPPPMPSGEAAEGAFTLLHRGRPPPSAMPCCCCFGIEETRSKIQSR